jgi:hypothetical protein
MWDPVFFFLSTFATIYLATSCSALVPKFLQSAARLSSSKARTARLECVPNVITVCPTGDRAPASGFVGRSIGVDPRPPITDSVVGGKKRTWLEMYGFYLPLPYPGTQRTSFYRSRALGSISPTASSFPWCQSIAQMSGFVLSAAGR